MGELLLIQVTGRAVSQAASAGKAGFEAAHPSSAQAEACFNQSIEIARQQKTKSWEVRTAMSMARLYQSQSKQKEARVLLAEIYDRFTEGFDTVDMREAKALLDKLS